MNLPSNPGPPPLLDGLVEFLGAAPSPFHAAHLLATQLEAAGWSRVDETDEWPRGPGRYVVVRGGSLVAWIARDAEPSPFRIVGAHTDSPNLRLMPRPDTGRLGFCQFAIEVYGGALWASWLDRDLGLSGRVVVRDGGDLVTQLVHIERPIARIPQLAIHLDRTVNTEGLRLDPQTDLRPFVALGGPREGLTAQIVADEIDVEPRDIVAMDLMLHDVTPPTLSGLRNEFLSSARIDNLVSCWAAIHALLAADLRDDGAPIPVVCLFDHEEIGSVSASGADSQLLGAVLERIALAAGSDREGFLRRLATSRCVSADGAHATSPNRPERHEPRHLVQLGGGPVLKSNANERYASDAIGLAELRTLADDHGVAVQEFAMRADMACGSTIGPVTASRLGVTTVDVGLAQLAMHSSRELCAVADVAPFVKLLGAFLRESRS